MSRVGLRAQNVSQSVAVSSSASLADSTNPEPSVSSAGGIDTSDASASSSNLSVRFTSCTIGTSETVLALCTALSRRAAADTSRIDHPVSFIAGRITRSLGRPIACASGSP